jgi:thiaminase/transcriptional activator TenA
MAAFTDHLVEANRDLWAAMADHPFVLGLADGTLPGSALRAWVQQDRVFVMEERRVLAALRAHGLPSRLDELLADLDRSLVLEADAFTQTATDQGFARNIAVEDCSCAGLLGQDVSNVDGSPLRRKSYASAAAA